jgi:GNAT superfamily N-acetyltransferase
MARQVNLRLATADDAGELARLNLLFNGVAEAAEQLAVRWADPRRVETPLLAEVDGRVVGLAALRVVPCVFYAASRAELTELFVEEPYRRRGVGCALMAYAECLALESGAEELFVLTGLGNHAAQAFYQAFGYRDDDLALSKRLRR